jgi:hypothetical protein
MCEPVFPFAPIVTHLPSSRIHYPHSNNNSLAAPIRQQTVLAKKLKQKKGWVAKISMDYTFFVLLNTSLSLQLNGCDNLDYILMAQLLQNSSNVTTVPFHKHVFIHRY